MKSILLASVVSLALFSAGCASLGEAPATQRNTTFGPVQGVDDSAATGTLHWKGIPFAAPPVAQRRWRAPADPTSWQVVRQTTQFAPACAQAGRLYGPGLNNRYDATIGSTLGQTLGNEDCLYLNIWQPSTRSSQPRPVIVWVHGGSNITGYAADPVYDGAALARTADAVVVSVQYRLGIFGFLDLEALKTGNPEEDSGNFALLDIMKALAFVKENIAQFGGDPDRVSLMGESAGAVNVYALLSSPMLAQASPKLFHRVIALSGGISSAATLPAGAIAGVLPRRVWQQRGQALLEHSLLADGTARDPEAAKAAVASRSANAWADYLRSKSADELLTTVQKRLVPARMAGSNPIPDGHVVAPDTIAAIRTGHYVKVPVLAGNTRDETKLFPTLLAIRPSLGGVSGRLIDDAAVFRIAHTYKPEAPPATRMEDWIPAALLPTDAPGTGFNARTRELDRIWFGAIRDDVLNALHSQQPQVWHYRFDWDELPAPFDQIFGAAHAFDLPFVFGNFGPSLFANISFTEGNRPGRLALSHAMMKSVGAFAHRGDPNHAGLNTPWPQWPSSLLFDADADRTRIGTSE